MTAASEEALRGWLTRRVTVWNRLADLALNLGSRRAESASEAFDVAEGYRTVARDLSLARRLLPRSRTRQSLESLYLSLHALLHRPATRVRSDLLHLLRFELRTIVSQLRVHIAAVVLLLVLSALAGAWLVGTYPDLIGLVASDEMISNVESGELWTGNIFNVVPPAVVSLGILTNNIVVSLFAFCAGALFGLGTFYIIGMNGFMLGALFTFTARYDLAGRLFEFVVAHGLVELSVICLAGAAGASVGEALIRPPGSLTRREAFRSATSRAMKLLGVCAALLVGAGLIEGFISPDETLPLSSHVAVGVAYWILMFTALSGDLFGRRRALQRQLAA